MTYTPEPWEYDPVDRVIVEEGVRDIAHMDRTATEQDARLIVTAPEMLEALVNLLNDLDEHATGSFGKSEDVARAAIAKARGEL